jgi:uncharacterized damage-inducible protein DinB
LDDKNSLIEDFATIIPFVESLCSLDDEKWVTPLAEGKWTTRDVIAHIMLWDKYFLENAIAKITGGQEITVENLDFNEFNQQAVEFAKSKTKQEIIELTIQYRNEILNQLQQLTDEEFTKVHHFGENNQLSTHHFVEDFIQHDQHHIRQIDAFLKAIS